MKLKKVFEDLQKHKASYIQSKEGVDFEDRFESALKRFGFTKEIKEDEEIKTALDKLKKDVMNDFNEGPMKNVFNNNGRFVDMFVREPYGSQNYPDFLIFTKDYIIPVEIKFSSKAQKKPMWNGNLPKAGGIYIFGNYVDADLTFFRGIDVLSNYERKKLISFWDDVRALQKKYETELKKDSNFKNEYGFNVYLRKTFNQGKSINNNAILDFFNNTKRDELEQNVMDFLSKIN